ncbi:Imm1 family immunity protein [Kribbella sp. HUAS MG21]|uniref:Imm1 family immunity protein n=1 Tax=Kribbella sp. HUAS MG21 TaxID=3160966 RepID=A0AAU7TIJ1_9ACTN
MNDFLTAYYDDDAGQQRIGSQAELDELLDRVVGLPRPTWLELVSADELATMNIGLAAAFSSLTLYDDEGSAKYRSAGTFDEPHEATFDYGGVPTCMGKGSAITVKEARAAASEFLATGRRPELVVWELAVD